MHILAVDTAAASCSVAVVANDRLAAELTVTDGRSHTRHLMSMIEKVLKLAGLTLEQLDGFAVSRGPGSFTGLRIGISTVKGLAAASGKPVAGISSLEALAVQAAAGTPLIGSFMDARKGEIYFSFHQATPDGLVLQGPERVDTPAKALQGVDRHCMFVGSGARLYRRVIRQTLGPLARFSPAGADTLRASTLAGMARDRFAKNHMDDYCRLAPVYIRKSDAEIHRKGV